MRTLRAMVVGVVVAAGLAGCGAGTPPDAGRMDGDDGRKAPPKDAALSAEEKCFAIATVQREKKAGEPEKVGLRHVLVRYQGAKNANEAITRSRGQACLRALEARDKMLAGADFDDIVKEYSDEAGAAERRGSIGSLERRELEPPFADAAFELSVQQMSDVVETSAGFHLILRTE